METGWIERQTWDSANIIKCPCRIWRVSMAKFIQFCFIENFHDNLLEKAKMRTKSKSKNPIDCMCFRHLKHLFSGCASKLWVFKKSWQKTDMCVTDPPLPGPECWLWLHRPALLSRSVNAEITRPQTGTFLFPLPLRDAAKICFLRKFHLNVKDEILVQDHGAQASDPSEAGPVPVLWKFSATIVLLWANQYHEPDAWSFGVLLLPRISSMLHWI